MNRKNNFKGFAFPKRTRKRVQKEDYVPESVLQEFANIELSRNGVFYIRIPDNLNSAVMRNPSIPVHVKKIYSDALAGLPDNLLLIPITDRYCLAMCMEIKSKMGRLSRKQRRISRDVGYAVPRNTEEITKAIDDFINMAKLLRKNIE